MTVAMSIKSIDCITLYDMNEIINWARVGVHNSAFYSTKCDVTKATIDKTIDKTSVQRFRYWFIVRSLQC